MLSVALSLLLIQISAQQEGQDSTSVALHILGTIQDAGSPHIACKKDCCRNLFLRPATNRKVVSLGVTDAQSGHSYLFEATPDMPSQLKLLKEAAGSHAEVPNGVFLTHAHIGHYSGLMYFGREAMNASSVPVYAMPRMHKFLHKNGPWSLLIENENIAPIKISADEDIELTEQLSVTPMLVPHRDEFSETVGYVIEGPNKSALFIPDIDKWSKWDRDIREEISKVDFAFLDGTFYDAEEMNNRDISEIPHPFVIESMKLFKDLSAEEKQKIHFIHFNHTNPVIKTASPQFEAVIMAGFKVANYGEKFEL